MVWPRETGLMVADALSRAEALLRLGERLALSADHPAELAAEATRAVGDLFGDATALFTLDAATGEIALAAYAHPDPDRRAAMDALRPPAEHRLGEGIVGRLLADGRSAYWPDIPGELLESALPIYREYFGRFGLSGLMFAVLQARGTTLGLLGVSRERGAPRFTEDDFALLQQAAGPVALALDNARLLRRVLAELVERRHTEGRLRHQATHDALTGLPNRALLRTTLAERPADARTALLLLDLDGFKDVNDGLGHEVGDAALVRVAERLSSAVPPVGLLARLGGDEFAVVLPDDFDIEAAVGVAFRLRESLVEPLALDVPVVLDASVGVAIVPDHTPSPQGLLGHADMAMYRAKQSGAGVAVYDEVADEPQSRRLARVSRLREGLLHDELVLHWQPLVEVASGRLVSVEALVRWQRDGVLVPPAEFVPLAEQSGLIRPLTDWVVATTVAQLASWAADGLVLRAAVNVPGSVLDGMSLIEELLRLLGAADLPPQRVELEVSEGVLVDGRARETLRAGVRLGLGVAVDDFGTGWSSLAYLKELPATTLKIDGSFVAGLTTDERDTAIVEAVVALGRRLGMATVAERVEDDATLQALRELGVDLAQGHHLCAPVPAGELRAWAAAHA